MNYMQNLLGGNKSNSIKTLPVSVIDVVPQKKRVMGNHSSYSSRMEYSPFPTEISDLCYQFFLKDCKNIIDPFAGWGERHAKALEWDKRYVGFDISEVAIENALKQYGVDNILADSMEVDIPEFDGLLTCPPYWNLEKYSSDEGLDKEESWEAFKISLGNIFKRFYDKASESAVFCVVVGDWRKNHIYYDFEFTVCDIFKNLGAVIVDKVIISRKKVSKIKIMLPQAKRLGYTVKVHETLLVFKK